MRQNINDIHHLPDKKATTLQYGLTINIDLGNFTLEETDLSSDKIELDIKADKSVEVKEITNALQDKEFKTIMSYLELKNKFEEFHASNISNAVIIKIPKNKKLSDPVQINTELLSENSLHHVIVIAEENSEAVILDSLSDKNNKPGYNSKFLQVLAKKGAKIEYFHAQKISKEKLHYSKKIGLTEDNAEINWHDFAIGSKVTISDLTSVLVGHMSKSLVQSVFFSDEDQQFDILGQAIHRSSHTFSDIEARGAIKDKSKSLYKGNVHIEQNANDSEGFQKADLIMLDNEAEADAIPQLLIDNNEVKCSHAVAIGRLDDEMIFYLMSRGLTRDEAKHQIVRGFFESVIDGISIEKISDGLREDIERKMIE